MRILLLLCVFCIGSCLAQISRVGQRVDIIVDSALYSDSRVAAAIDRYSDAVKESYGIAIKTYGFTPASKGATAEQLKAAIQKSWESSDGGKLEGVILVGDLPRALMEFPQWNNSVFRYQRWMTDYYFMDMDGVWLDTASGWFHRFGGKLKDSILAMPNFSIGSNAPFDGAPADSFSIRFEGYYKASQTGLCSLKVISDNHRRIFFGDTAVIDAWINDYDKPYYGAVELDSGKIYPVKIEYAEDYGGANFNLYYKYPDDYGWIKVPDSAWFLDASGTQPGIRATYFANQYLQDVVDHPGENANWQSGVPNGVFDGHYSKDGAVSDSFEIWISRVDPYTASIYASPKTLLLQWLEKAAASHEQNVHTEKSAYFITADADTTGASDRKFLNGLRALYPSTDPETMLADGNIYAQKITEDYDWVTYVGHGNELGLGNGFYVAQLKYPYEVGPRVFHFASCSPMYAYGYDGKPYSISVGSAHVFGTTGGGLAAVGATKTSGDNQLDDLMYYAAHDSLLGEAYLSWVNQRIKQNRYPGTGIYDWFYVESLLGDPFVSMSLEKVGTPIGFARQIPTRLLKSDKRIDAKGRPALRNRINYYYVSPLQD